MCRCAPSSRARRSRSRRRGGGVALAELRRVGAQQRRERRDLDRQVLARDRARRCRPRARAAPGGGGRRSTRPVERLAAACRVAVGLGGGDRRLAEQVDARWRRRRFHRSSSTPVASRGVSPTMKRWAMCLTPAAAAAPSAARPALDSDIRIATCSGGGRSSTSSRKPVRWRARSSSERQAGTTSTKRNSAARSSASCEARSIALSSSAFSGLPRGPGQRRGEVAPDGQDVGFGRRGGARARRYRRPRLAPGADAAD